MNLTAVIFPQRDRDNAAPLSAYESRRQERIQRNKAFLKNLSVRKLAVPEKSAGPSRPKFDAKLRIPRDDAVRPPRRQATSSVRQHCTTVGCTGLCAKCVAQSAREAEQAARARLQEARKQSKVQRTTAKQSRAHQYVQVLTPSDGEELVKGETCVLTWRASSLETLRVIGTDGYVMLGNSAVDCCAFFTAISLAVNRQLCNDRLRFCPVLKFSPILFFANGVEHSNSPFFASCYVFRSARRRWRARR